MANRLTAEGLTTNGTTGMLITTSAIPPVYCFTNYSGGVSGGTYLRFLSMGCIESTASPGSWKYSNSLYSSSKGSSYSPYSWLFALRVA